MSCVLNNSPGWSWATRKMSETACLGLAFWSLCWCHSLLWEQIFSRCFWCDSHVKWTVREWENPLLCCCCGWFQKCLLLWKETKSNGNNFNLRSVGSLFANLCVQPSVRTWVSLIFHIKLILYMCFHLGVQHCNYASSKIEDRSFTSAFVWLSSLALYYKCWLTHMIAIWCLRGVGDLGSLKV